MKASPPTADPNGPALAHLLFGGFQRMVDVSTIELAKRGHPDVRAHHEFAMRAIEAGAGTAIELAGRLGISKQAAAKTIAVLEARGYVTRRSDRKDARRKALSLTSNGRDMLMQGQAILDELRRAWVARIGADRFVDAENVLRELLGEPAEMLDAAAWLGPQAG